MSEQGPGNEPGVDDPQPTHRPSSGGWSTLRIVLTVLLGVPLALLIIALLVLGACLLSMG